MREKDGRSQRGLITDVVDRMDGVVYSERFGKKLCFRKKGGKTRGKEKVILMCLS